MKEPSAGPGRPPSVVSHNGQSTQLGELGLGVPLPLLIAQPRLVHLTRQLAEDLVHFREIDHLGRADGGSVKGGALWWIPARLGSETFHRDLLTLVSRRLSDLANQNRFKMRRRRLP